MQRCAHAVGSKLKQECAHADLEEEQEPELAEKQGQAHHQEEGQELEQDPDRDCNNFGQSGLTRAAGEQTQEEGRSFTAPQDNQEILYLWFMI